MCTILHMGIEHHTLTMAEFWFLQAFFEIFADPQTDQLDFKKMVRIESEVFTNFVHLST